MINIDYNNDSQIEKVNIYEMAYIKVTLFFSIVCMCAFIANILFIEKSKIAFDIFMNNSIFFGVLITVNLCKLYPLKKNIFYKSKVYYSFRFIEFIGVYFAVISVSTLSTWIILPITFLFILTTLFKGIKSSAIIYSSNLIIYSILIANNLILNNLDIYTKIEISLILNFFIISTIAFCSILYKFNNKVENEKKIMLQDIESKYKKQVSINNQLEQSNLDLQKRAAEIFILQEITQTIGTIFEVKELLKQVNDIILGVMGVTCSTIALYDDKKCKVNLYDTNIKKSDELALMKDNINCEELHNVLDRGKSILENNVDPEKYTFVKNRDIKSIIIVPLRIKTRKFGVVIIEHKNKDSFDYSKVDLMEIISQQVGYAMENAELYEKMQEMATIDGLTGIYNRMYFQGRLNKELELAKEGKYSLALAIFDIDFFKKFNDTYGHLFGDLVLKNTTDTVKRSLRSTDVFARYGGEEFIIIFPRTSLKESFEKVDRLRKAIEQNYVKYGETDVKVTVSFGIACYPINAIEEKNLISCADDALYQAKAAGRNCVKIAVNQIEQLSNLQTEDDTSNNKIEVSIVDKQ